MATLQDLSGNPDIPTDIAYLNGTESPEMVKEILKSIPKYCRDYKSHITKAVSDLEKVEKEVNELIKNSIELI